MTVEAEEVLRRAVWAGEGGGVAYLKKAGRVSEGGAGFVLAKAAPDWGACLWGGVEGGGVDGGRLNRRWSGSGDGECECREHEEEGGCALRGGGG